MKFNTYGLTPVDSDPDRLAGIMRDCGGLVGYEYDGRGVTFTLKNGIKFYVDNKVIYGNYHTCLAYMRSGVAQCLAQK